MLLVHRYFHPDVPTYAHMLRYIGARLVRDGHDVSVFCGYPSYNDAYQGPPVPASDNVEGMHVHRVRLPPDRKQQPAIRALSMLVFALRLFAHVLRHRSKYDVITVTTIPPVIMGLVARAISRATGIPYVYHCMDLYPEVAALAGMSDGPLFRIARRIDASTCRRADVVVVLSNDMRATLARRGIDTANVVVLNNFVVVDDETPGATSETASHAAVADVIGADPTRFRVVFAGNLGRFQGLQNLMTAALRVAAARPAVEFVFIGSGSIRDELRRQAGDAVGRSVRFVDYQPVSVVAQALEHAQLGVISLGAGIHEVAYPSKTATYLATGCRLLAIVESGSDLAELVRTEDLGVSCPPDEPDRLADLIISEIDRGAPSAGTRDRIRSAGERYFGRAAKLDEWAVLLGNRS